MASRNPDFAALSEAAYEAADAWHRHDDTCPMCSHDAMCVEAYRLRTNSDEAKEKALKAIRGKK